MAKPKTTWFIFTGGHHLADAMIADTGRLGSEDECRDTLCSDGKRRDLWRCPDYCFVRVFEQAAEQIAPVPYRIYCQRGPHGAVRERGFNPSRMARQMACCGKL